MLSGWLHCSSWGQDGRLWMLFHWEWLLSRQVHTIARTWRQGEDFINDHVLLNNQQRWLMEHTIPYNKLPIQSFVKISRVVHATHMSLVAALMESASLEVPAKRVAHARWSLSLFLLQANVQDTEFGCCDDRRTPAQGIDDLGCGCAASVYGCCPDGTNC